MSKRWTTNEVIELKELYPYNEISYISEKLQKSISSIYVKANKLGLKNRLKSPLTSEIVLKLYVDEGMNIKDIAKKYKVSSPYVSKLIPNELKRGFRNLNEQDVINSYNNIGSIVSVSKIYKVRPETVKNILLNNNIKIKAVGENYTVKLPTTEIIDLYYYGFSATEIGNFYNVSHTTIISRLKENDIELKEHSFYVSGSKSNTWKGGITPEHARIRQSDEYKEWRKATFMRDLYVCQCCNDSKGGNLHAHYIKNFSDYGDLRFEISNAITLCNSCHNPSVKDSFHHTYGTRNNTLEQLQEYFDAKRTELNLPLVSIKEIVYNQISNHS